LPHVASCCAFLLSIKNILKKSFGGSEMDYKKEHKFVLESETSSMKEIQYPNDTVSLAIRTVIFPGQFFGRGFKKIQL
jgi:hypothetical protein